MPEAAPIALLRGLAVLAEPPEAPHAAVAAALGLPRAPTSSEYSDIFLFQLYPYASVHLGAEGMIGGEARSRVAGFWNALHLTPPAEPDHLAALLGLYASLAEREAEEGEGAEAALMRRGRAALLEEHLTPWVFAFARRVEELGGEVYGAWGALLGEVLAEERRRFAPVDRGLPLSRHLTSAPPLPDPRSEGGEAFLSGVLAPVRSGAILTRADLARVAREAGVGLRAGERRYALESMLSQDAEAVLRLLASEFRRQGALHREAGGEPGPVEDFLAGRASASADLLEDLSRDASAVLS